MGRSWQTLNFKTNKICQQYDGPYLSYNPHCGFAAKRIAIKAARIGQVFPHATCNNHSFVVLFVFVCACVRACVRACVCACVRVCVC